MDPRTSTQLVPLHLTSFAIISPTNGPLYVHSFTGKSDQLRHYHLTHAALDVVEERIVMTSSPSKPAESYLGLLFCMEDMAFYGFQTHTKLRMVLSVALVDAMIKDADIVAIFRSVHHLLLTAIHNPFLSLPSNFHALQAHNPNGPTSITLAPSDSSDPTTTEDKVASITANDEKIVNPMISTSTMFETSPNSIQGDWLKQNEKFQMGIKRIGELLSGGRA